ncbi:MAG: lamin tail domain-containing protein [Nocardioidaceae bacterium]
MKRLLLAAAAACALAAPTVTTAAAHASPAPDVQQLVSPLRFTYIQYDSPGSDNGSNASINAEFVTIYNPSSIARPLTGFRVHDLQSHFYRFGTFQLGPHKSVRLHTGKGTNTATNRYWGQGYYVWNNTGDSAFLVSAGGDRVDFCHWGDGPGSIHC